MSLNFSNALQVSGRVPPGSVMNAAQKLSKGRAQLALQLVGFEVQLTAAMQYVFGSAFICQVQRPLNAPAARCPAADCFDLEQASSSGASSIIPNSGTMYRNGSQLVGGPCSTKGLQYDAV